MTAAFENYAVFIHFLYISVPEMVQVYLFMLLLICLFVILLPTQCLLFFNDLMHEIRMHYLAENLS